MLTDQYGGLLSKEFATYLTSENITHIFTATDASFSNGQNERLNQTLVNRIRCRVNESQSKISWQKIAHQCTAEYNNTIHSATKFSPSYLMHGNFPRVLPAELIQQEDLQKDRKIALQ